MQPQQKTEVRIGVRKDRNEYIARFDSMKSRVYTAPSLDELITDLKIAAYTFFGPSEIVLYDWSCESCEEGK